jgi:2-(1,2-epoxy-1,2-dihydrophenyl)acetyl-CoA isomerase
MASNTVLVEREAGVATVSLNRPDRMNSLTDELMVALAERLREVAADDEVRCVVLTGTGDRAFSAGADLAPPGRGVSESVVGDAEGLEPAIDRLKRYQESSWLLHTMPKPTLAGINGAAAGASLSMTAACDFRYAADNAVMTTAFANIGFSGDFGGSYFMTAILGTAKARDLYLTGRRFDAEEALRMGFVHGVFPREAFRKEVAAIARRLAEGPPIAYRYMKRNLNLALQLGARDLLDLEAEAMMRTGRTQDFREATQAFLAKQKPVFRGR